MSIEQLIIIGAGGHSKVVEDALSYQEQVELIICDDALIGKITSAGHTIRALQKPLSNISTPVHVAIGNNLVRKRLYEELSPNTRWQTVVHPAAVISGKARLGQGSFVAANAILGPDSQIGVGCIINHAAVVDHDVQIGAYSHIAPNSTLGGKVVIGEMVLVGAGAIILPDLMIGKGAIVAAGAVVTRNVAEQTVVKGVPAR